MEWPPREAPPPRVALPDLMPAAGMCADLPGISGSANPTSSISGMWKGGRVPLHRWTGCGTWLRAKVSGRLFPVLQTRLRPLQLLQLLPLRRRPCNKASVGPGRSLVQANSHLRGAVGLCLGSRLTRVRAPKVRRRRHAERFPAPVMPSARVLSRLRRPGTGGKNRRGRGVRKPTPLARARGPPPSLLDRATLQPLPPLPLPPRSGTNGALDRSTLPSRPNAAQTGARRTWRRKQASGLC